MPRVFSLLLFVAFQVAAVEPKLHTFERLTLSTEYYSEGANFGDVSGDGVVDIVSGPYWYAGPDYKAKREIYPPKPQNRDRYADNFGGSLPSPISIFFTMYWEMGNYINWTYVGSNYYESKNNY